MSTKSLISNDDNASFFKDICCSVFGMDPHKFLEEAFRGLQHKNGVKYNVRPVNSDMAKEFQIDVPSPQVLTLNIETPGRITLSLVRSGAFTAHVEGTVSYFKSSQDVPYYQSAYRSDNGFEHSLDVTSGDVISISMEAHHFASAVVGQGSSEMELSIKYHQ